jgi:hypothetical protein
MSTIERPWRVLFAAALLTAVCATAAPAAGLKGTDQPAPSAGQALSTSPPKAVHPQIKHAKRASTHVRRSPIRLASEADEALRLCARWHLCGRYVPLFLGVAY